MGGCKELKVLQAEDPDASIGICKKSHAEQMARAPQSKIHDFMNDTTLSFAE